MRGLFIGNLNTWLGEGGRSQGTREAVVGGRGTVTGA